VPEEILNQRTFLRIQIESTRYKAGGKKIAGEKINGNE
jgi:hypothetical protein